MYSAIETFDAIRGLPSEMAELISKSVWDTASKNKELGDELVRIVAELEAWETWNYKTSHVSQSVYTDREAPAPSADEQQLYCNDVPW
jgi:hypothetical protein